MKTPDKETGVPMTDGELEAERALHHDGLEVVIDATMVSIPVTRYDELVAAEAKLDVVLRAYQCLDSYDWKDVLLAIFGTKPEADHA